jgi:uncharacterized protein YndB with AHSA1/START domain
VTALIGKTKDAGWEIGVSKTIPYSVEQVWDLLTSDDGIRIWLGAGARLEPRRGAPYETDAGTTGEIRGFREHDRVRLTWRPPDWDHDSTVQFSVSPSGDRTVLRFHQERLADAAERDRQRAHWQRVMTAVLEALARNP